MGVPAEAVTGVANTWAPLSVSNVLRSEKKSGPSLPFPQGDSPAPKPDVPIQSKVGKIASIPDRPATNSYSDQRLWGWPSATGASGSAAVKMLTGFFKQDKKGTKLSRSWRHSTHVKAMIKVTVSPASAGATIGRSFFPSKSPPKGWSSRSRRTQNAAFLHFRLGDANVDDGDSALVVTVDRDCSEDVASNLELLSLLVL